VTVFDFTVTHADGEARRGVLTTPHGAVQTPCFMPVGTRGAVKGITHRDLEDAGAEFILGNTYHLHLRPGDDLIARAGGLHAFIGWNKPILTDSGGYQVFSLAARRKVTEDSVTFRSHLDGALCVLTPEKATDIQAQLGSDIAMVLDELVGPDERGARREARDPVSEARGAMERSVRWAARARARLRQLREDPRSAPEVIVTNPGQAQFGIVQGGTDFALRTESVQRTVAIGFESYSIGGLSVGEPAPVMYDIVAHTTPYLPVDQPRYLMGTGTPEDLVESVARGIDLFDCVLPTRNARNGQLFTSEGRLNIKNARFAEDDRPPDPNCSCYTCRTCSRAYLRHLFNAGEINASTLNTLHNLHFYLDTLSRIRDAIAFGRFENFRLAFRQRLSRQTEGPEPPA
jgi:queuine tRNA-ribosyltransferase